MEHAPACSQYLCWLRHSFALPSTQSGTETAVVRAGLAGLWLIGNQAQKHGASFYHGSTIKESEKTMAGWKSELRI